MKVGDPVWHRSRGWGTLTALHGVGAEAEIDVRFADGATRTYKLELCVASGSIVPGCDPRVAGAPKRKHPGLIIGAPAPISAAPVQPAAPLPPAAPTKDPVMLAKPTASAKPIVPHQLVPRVLAACKQRGISRADAIREMRISTGSWHALTHGIKIGPRLTTKVEAWLAPGAVRAARSVRAKSAAKPARREPQAIPQPMPVDLLRALVRQLNLPVVRAWIIKDDQLCERQAVVLA